MRVIALCLNLPMDGWRTKEFGKKYPGAGWCKWMPELTRCSDTMVLTGQEALDYPVSKDILVIQEEHNEIGTTLIRRGAKAQVNFCLESPIFASRFYDDVPSYFKHSLLFDGGSEYIYFPSFDDEDILEPKPWSERKHLCMVTSNKHYRGLQRPENSKTWKKALEGQLHDYRYLAIDHFGTSGQLDLYGRGWNTNFGCPHPYRGECADKLATISNYKFALCFENGSYPGYITEKIIDCFVAGVIPVYRGAPDTERWIPNNLALDSTELGLDFTSLELWLKDLGEHARPDRIERAQAWLRSPEGQKYNNRVFAKRIVELCAS